MQLLTKLVIIFCVHIILSIVLLSRRRKKTSYIVEILITLGAITYELSLVNFSQIPNYIIFYVLEYVVAKITILIIISILRYISFYAIVSISKNKAFAKIGYKIIGKRNFCKLASNFNRLDYGPRFKLGLPGMVNKTHKRTGVKFDNKGFPKFKSLCTIKLNRKYFNKSREVHFYHASKILYEKSKKNISLRNKFSRRELKEFSEGDVPSRYTWHHHQDKGVLQLVDKKVHADVNHIGGFSIWGKR